MCREFCVPEVILNRKTQEGKTRGIMKDQSKNYKAPYPAFGSVPSYFISSRQKYLLQISVIEIKFYIHIKTDKL
jgi:hypothetical protein